MSEPAGGAPAPLSRRSISEAVADLGWRFLLGRLSASVAVESMPDAGRAAACAIAAAGEEADALTVDLRPSRVVLTLQDPDARWVTRRELDLAARVSQAVADAGFRLTAAAPARSDQALEIAVDALDIPAVRPFWKAVLGYVDARDDAGPEDDLVDPVGQGPAVWFQQMDAPRPQRNRIHVDVTVPHDEAPHRVTAALDAGGRLVSDAAAPTFWVLADAEGNEACVSTWQGRDG